MTFMNVSVPTWSSLKVSYNPPSYFIYDKSLGLILYRLNKEEKAYIYNIAKGGNFHEININDMVEDRPRHRTYFPSLAPISTFT